jgi:F1F0 ATPase subunit 2
MMDLAPVMAALLGAALGFAYFSALRLNARLYLAEGPLWRPVVLHLLRIVGVVSAFVLIAPYGAGALLGALAGFVVMRFVLVRPERSGA